MRRIEFQVGETVNGFTFVQYTRSHKDGHVQGMWICPVCKQTVTRKNDVVASGRIKSCGCAGTYNLKARSKHSNPDYCWEIIMHRIKLRCRRSKKLTCSITVEYLKKLYHQQDGRCFYTRKEIIPPYRYTRLFDKDILSVDRIDSSLGYVEGNICLVTKEINMMKQVLSHDRFVELCHTVASNFPL